MHEKWIQNVNYFPLLLSPTAYTLQPQEKKKKKCYANRANCTWELSKMVFEEFFFPTKYKADVLISF